MQALAVVAELWPLAMADAWLVTRRAAERALFRRAPDLEDDA